MINQEDLKNKKIYEQTDKVRKFIIEDFELQRKENDKIKFHSFYFAEDKKNGVLIESSEYLNNIQHNSIEDKFEEQHLQSIEKAFKN